jgi:uncharacterized membrane protein
VTINIDILLRRAAVTIVAGTVLLFIISIFYYIGTWIVTFKYGIQAIVAFLAIIYYLGIFDLTGKMGKIKE